MNFAFCTKLSDHEAAPTSGPIRRVCAAPRRPVAPQATPPLPTPASRAPGEVLTPKSAKPRGRKRTPKPTSKPSRAKKSKGKRSRNQPLAPLAAAAAAPVVAEAEFVEVDIAAQVEIETEVAQFAEVERTPAEVEVTPGAGESQSETSLIEAKSLLCDERFVLTPGNSTSRQEPVVIGGYDCDLPPGVHLLAAASAASASACVDDTPSTVAQSPFSCVNLDTQPTLFSRTPVRDVDDADADFDVVVELKTPPPPRPSSRQRWSRRVDQSRHVLVAPPGGPDLLGTPNSRSHSVSYASDTGECQPLPPSPSLLLPPSSPSLPLPPPPSPSLPPSFPP